MYDHSWGICLSWRDDTGECYLIQDFQLTVRVPYLDNQNLAGAWINIW